MPTNTSQQVELTTQNTLSLTLGIIATIIGVASLLIGWIPFLGLFAIPCAVIGFILAMVGGIIALVKKGKGVGLPILGAVICAAGLLLPIFSTGGVSMAVNQAMVDAQKKQSQNAEVRVIPSVEATPKPAQAAPQSSETPQSAVPKKEEPKLTWNDAKDSLRVGDVQITIRELKVGKVPVKDLFSEEKQSNDDLLAVTIEVKNLSEVKKIDFRGWNSERMSFDGEYTSLTDNNENIYKRINFGSSTKVVGSTAAESIYPGAAITDVLIFEKPVDAAKWLHLELPAKNFKAAGIVRFEIQASTIRR